MKIKICFQKSPKDVPSQPPTKLFPHPLLLTPTFNTFFHPPHLAHVCGTKNKARSSQLNPFPPPTPSGGWALQSPFRSPTLLSCPLVPKGSLCGQSQPHSPSTHTDPSLAEDKTTRMSCQQHTQEASERTILAPKISLDSQVPQLLPEPQCLADLSSANLQACPVQLRRAPRAG